MPCLMFHARTSNNVLTMMQLAFGDGMVYLTAKSTVR